MAAAIYIIVVQFFSWIIYANFIHVFRKKTDVVNLVAVSLEIIKIGGYFVWQLYYISVGSGSLRPMKVMCTAKRSICIEFR